MNFYSYKININLPSINNNWIIISVILPGTLFYVSLFTLTTIFNLENPFFATINTNGVLTGAVIVACGLFLQLFGMITEDIGFQVWNWKNFRLRSAINVPLNYSYKRTKEQTDNIWRHKFWEKRYEIMSKAVETNSGIERIIAQFFMAHNISVGFCIHCIWVTAFLINENKFYTYIQIPCILIILFAVTAIVSQIRFRNCINSFYQFANGNKSKLEGICFNKIKKPKS